MTKLPLKPMEKGHFREETERESNAADSSTNNHD